MRMTLPFHLTNVTVTHQNMSPVKCFDLIFKIKIFDIYISQPSMKITSKQQMSVSHIISSFCNGSNIAEFTI